MVLLISKLTAQMAMVSGVAVFSFINLAQLFWYVVLLKWYSFAEMKSHMSSLSMDFEYKFIHWTYSKLYFYKIGQYQAFFQKYT